MTPDEERAREQAMELIRHVEQEISPQKRPIMHTVIMTMGVVFVIGAVLIQLAGAAFAVALIVTGLRGPQWTAVAIGMFLLVIDAWWAWQYWRRG